MKASTRLFGNIDIEDDKILILENGIIGFPDMKKFTLIYDNESGDQQSIIWLQSMDEPHFAMPVLSPGLVKPDYNPMVNDDLLAQLGEFNNEDLVVLVTLKVPADIKDMTVNLKAPIIINYANKKGAQIIVENEDYPVRYPIYDILQSIKEEANK
ncbi:MAG: flagellar assembly protein FliW [Lachnospiraceae bacterium]|jgi:flagellar assembly factor FliW|nr:flagellar assembly protein FliW [Lachnospiraceae bacterium]